jgi:hypothetical protein
MAVQHAIHPPSSLAQAVLLKQSCSSSLAQAALPVKISNGSSKDVLFKIAHTAGLPHQAVGYSCFFLSWRAALPP